MRFNGAVYALLTSIILSFTIFPFPGLLSGFPPYHPIPGNGYADFHFSETLLSFPEIVSARI
jgi:hypothetical protein